RASTWICASYRNRPRGGGGFNGSRSFIAADDYRNAPAIGGFRRQAGIAETRTRDIRHCRERSVGTGTGDAVAGCTWQRSPYEIRGGVRGVDDAKLVRRSGG